MPSLMTLILPSFGITLTISLIFFVQQSQLSRDQIGAALSQRGAAWLEENELFVPEEED